MSNCLKLNIIVASTRQGGIGYCGDLPWKRQLSRDLSNFKRITTTVTNPTDTLNVVIMGKHTWNSIPKQLRPLTQRYNIILTNDKETISEIENGTYFNTRVCSSLDAAMNHVKEMQEESYKFESVFIIGGAQLYAEALQSHLLDKIYLTQVLKPFLCDTYFPKMNLEHFDLVEESELQVENDVPFQFLTYRRNSDSDTKDFDDFDNLINLHKKILNQVDNDEYQYLDLIQEILEYGISKDDRTGVGTKSLFGANMRFSLRKNQFPLLTTKRVFFRGVVEELLWIIRGCTDSKALAAKNVHIWDENGSREFLDKLGFTDREVGDLGPGLYKIITLYIC